MYFWYFLLFSLNEIIKTNAAANSIEGSNHIALSVPCPYVHLRENLEPRTEKKVREYSVKCKRRCKAMDLYGYVTGEIKDELKAVCWNWMVMADMIYYDEQRKRCNCGWKNPEESPSLEMKKKKTPKKMIGIGDCNPPILYHDVISKDICIGKCKERSIATYQPEDSNFFYISDCHTNPQIPYPKIHDGRTFYDRAISKEICTCTIATNVENHIRNLDPTYLNLVSSSGYNINSTTFPHVSLSSIRSNSSTAQDNSWMRAPNFPSIMTFGSSENDRKLLACPYAYYTKKLNPYNEEEEKMFGEECMMKCSEKTSSHGIWYIKQNGYKGTACWDIPHTIAEKYSYDEATRICECGIHHGWKTAIRPCIPKMTIRDVSSSVLCEYECREKKVYSYISKKKVYLEGFCYVKDGYKYPSLVGKPTFSEHPTGQEFKCHCAVEDFPENALVAIEKRRVNLGPHDELYSRHELYVILDAMKTGTPISLPKVLPNLPAFPGRTSRPSPVCSVGEFLQTPLGTTPGSLVRAFPRISIRETRENSADPNSESLATTIQGSAAQVNPKTVPRNVTENTGNGTTGRTPTNSPIKKNPYSSAFVFPTRIGTENLVRQNNPQSFSAAPNTSTKAIQTDRKLLACPYAYYTKKLNPYSEEEEKIFGEECMMKCSEKTSSHGIWYIKQNGYKGVACWDTPHTIAEKYSYDVATQICECGMHHSPKTIRPCIPKMTIRDVSSSVLCEYECREKKVYSYISKKKVYLEGFCYVKDGYKYPSLVGKPTFSEHPTGQEFKCHCAVEDFPENALGAIEKRRVNFGPYDELYSRHELYVILDAMRTGTAIYLPKVLPNLLALSGRTSRPSPVCSAGEFLQTTVSKNPGSLVRAFPRISIEETQENLATPNSESSATTIKGSVAQVNPKTFSRNVSGNTGNGTAGRAPPDCIINQFSQASLIGVHPGTVVNALPTDSSIKRNPHATPFVFPTRIGTENFLRQNNPQSSSALPNTSTKAIQTGLPYFNNNKRSTSNNLVNSSHEPPSSVLPATEITFRSTHTTPKKVNSVRPDTTLTLGRNYAREDASTSQLSKKHKGGS